MFQDIFCTNAVRSVIDDHFHTLTSLSVYEHLAFLHLLISQISSQFNLQQRKTMYQKPYSPEKSETAPAAA
jgi:hypothetical protein